jgi:2,3-bisphosphoglycerate-dependent phosphoglycerate mutase
VTQIIFVRHAQSVPSPDIPEARWPLSDEGRAQARALAGILAELRVDALASSPYVRSLDTLRPYADAAGLPIQVDQDLRERGLGGWLTDPAAVQAAAARMHADPDFTLPGGENAAHCLRRFEAAIARSVTTTTAARLAIGSHGGILGHLLARHCPHLPIGFWRSIRFPHLFLFEYDGKLHWLGERTLDGSVGVTET